MLTLGCYSPAGPDAPGYGTDFDAPTERDPIRIYELRSSTVVDAVTGETLGSQCAVVGGGTGFGGLPGQRVTLTMLDYRVRTRSYHWNDCGQGNSGNDIDPKVLVNDPSCWTFNDDSPVRVLAQEVVPAEDCCKYTVLPNECCQPSSSDELVPGSGYRLELEVIGYGIFEWVPNGTCEVTPQYPLAVNPPL
jgi:hypothetical protein